MDLLQQFVDSELIRGLSTGDKALATLYITIMGMSITFVALCVLWGAISLLSVFFKPRSMKQIDAEVKQESTPAIADNSDGDIIAVITAAVAAAGNAPIHSFKVKSIIPTADHTPRWGEVGRIEQLTQTIKN